MFRNNDKLLWFLRRIQRVISSRLPWYCEADFVSVSQHQVRVHWWSSKLFHVGSKDDQTRYRTIPGRVLSIIV